MTEKQRFQNLSVPTGPVDVVLDTDTYNEIDDQFALSYLLKSADKLHTKAIYAAPFFNQHSADPADGMEKSYQEILKLLSLMDKEELEKIVYKGSKNYLPDENTPVDSPAARDLAARAMQYSIEHPLYVVAIGAITNVASALLLKPQIAEKIVIVWLGGHAHHFPRTDEFNMMQDVAAARVVMNSAAPFVQLPCNGVVSAFTTSGPELRHWLSGKGKLAEYLMENTIQEAESYRGDRVWTRAIWDVTAVAWLLNDNDRFMSSMLVPTPTPGYDNRYEFSLDIDSKQMRYVYHINRDDLMEDLFRKITA